MVNLAIFFSINNYSSRNSKIGGGVSSKLVHVDVSGRERQFLNCESRIVVAAGFAVVYIHPMTPTARLQAVLDLVTEITNTPRPADALTSAYFRARRYIGSKDRAFISTMLYDVLRHHARLDWWLKKYKSESTPRLRLLTYLMLAQKNSIAALDAMFVGGKFGAQTINDAERAVLRKLETHTLMDHPSMPGEVKAECPDWALEGLKKRFGDDLLSELQALLNSAPLDLRANSLKTTREAMLAEIKKVGMKAEPCAFSPLGIRVDERPNLNDLPMLKNGQIEIQDEGSQMVAFLVDAKPGQRVVDFCAGAGGKTLAIAASMQNKGRITACDVMEGRLKRSTERFRRAGVHNIETKPLSSESDPWVKRHKGTFDRVLVDAPCSGTGTWRRNPDGRWKHLGPNLENLLLLQAKILASAARLVKPGGRLVYATCSLLMEENEAQIEGFLAAHPDFQLVRVSEVLKETIPNTPCPSPDPYLVLTPARHNTDGFFGAVMERVKAEIPEEE